MNFSHTINFMYSFNQLREIPTKLKTLTKDLKFLSTVINDAPFILQENSIRVFKEINGKYRDLTHEGNSIVVEYGRTQSIPTNTIEFTEKLRNPPIAGIRL